MVRNTGNKLVVSNWLLRADLRVLGMLIEFRIRFLRAGPAVVFLWFGVLKVGGVSPVADLIEKASPFTMPMLLPVLGIVEIVVGLGLAWGKALRFVLLAFVLQMTATFWTFVAIPEQMFIGANPLRLTTLGEFVVKNLVLIAAGLTIASSLPSLSPSVPSSVEQASH